MRSIALLLCVASLALAGCKVCGIGACKAEQGRAVTAIIPNADGSLRITTCTVTTKGTSGTVDACRDHLVPSGEPPK